MNYTYKDFLLIKSIQQHPLRNRSNIDGSQCKSNLPLYLNKEAAKVRSESGAKAIAIMKAQSIANPLKACVWQEQGSREQKRVDNKLQSVQVGESVRDEEEELVRKGNLQLRKHREREQPLTSSEVLRQKLREELDSRLVGEMSTSFRLRKLSNFLRDSLHLDSEYVQQRSSEPLGLFEVKKLVRKPSFFEHASQRKDLHEDLEIIEGLEKEYGLDLLKALRLEHLPVKIHPVADEHCLLTPHSHDTHDPISVQEKYHDADRQLLIQIDKLSAATDLFQKKKQAERKQREKQQKEAQEQLHQRIIQFRKYKLHLSRQSHTASQNKQDQVDAFTTRVGTGSLWSPSTSPRIQIRSHSVHRPCHSHHEQDVANSQVLQVQRFNKMCQSASQKLLGEKKKCLRRINRINKQQELAYNNIKYKAPPAVYKMSKEYYLNQQKKAFTKKLIKTMIEQVGEQDQHMIATNVRGR